MLQASENGCVKNWPSLTVVNYVCVFFCLLWGQGFTVIMKLGIIMKYLQALCLSSWSRCAADITGSVCRRHDWEPARESPETPLCFQLGDDPLFILHRWVKLRHRLVTWLCISLCVCLVAIFGGIQSPCELTHVCDPFKGTHALFHSRYEMRAIRRYRALSRWINFVYAGFYVVIYFGGRS